MLINSLFGIVPIHYPQLLVLQLSIFTIQNQFVGSHKIGMSIRGLEIRPKALLLDNQTVDFHKRVALLAFDIETELACFHYVAD
jgi:hypothetical protein